MADPTTRVTPKVADQLAVPHYESAEYLDLAKAQTRIMATLDPNAELRAPLRRNLSNLSGRLNELVGKVGGADLAHSVLIRLQDLAESVSAASELLALDRLYTDLSNLKLAEDIETSEALKAWMDRSLAFVESVSGQTDSVSAIKALTMVAAERVLIQAAQREMESVAGRAIEAAKSLKGDVETQISTEKGKIEQVIRDALTESDQLKEKVRDNIALLGKVGLAEAFGRRAALLAKAEGWYRKGFFAILVLMLGALGLLVWHYWDESDETQKMSMLLALSGKSLPLDWLGLLSKVAVGSVLVWAGWYCSRMALITARVREDYEFKTAIATTYEAYKRETPDALLSALAQRVIGVYGDNPCRLYPHSKYLHGHPAGEVARAITDAMKSDGK